MDLHKLLSVITKHGASDLHLNAASRPIERVDGALIVLDNEEVLKPDILENLMVSITTEEQRRKLCERHELDFAYFITGVGRFRVNVCYQRNAISLTFRVVATDVAPLSLIGLPEIYAKLSLSRKGLILVTGPTGSGKSTTLAAMVNYINDTVSRLVISIEDPIEFVHPNKKSVILQLEVGRDTDSFGSAARNSLRHDPDVIVIGEMRDLETISAAITAAECGHLVMGTLHTIDAQQTVDRIIDVFPYGQQEQMRHQMSQVLLGVFSQVLVPRKHKGRVPACEIMIATPAVRNCIREAKTQNLQSVIQLGQKDNMQTLNQALAALVIEEKVEEEEVLQFSTDKDQLTKLIKSVRLISKPDLGYLTRGPEMKSQNTYETVDYLKGR